MEFVIYSLLILAVSGALSMKNKYIGLAGALIASLLTAVNNPLLLMILVIAIINLASLDLMKGFLRGVDYTLVGLIFVATVYAFYSQSLAFLLGMFVVASVPTYMMVMASDTGMRVEVGIKYMTFMVIATVLFLIGAVLMVHASATSSLALYYIGFTMLIVGLAIEVGAGPFHEWVPDVFETADPIPISVIASIAKFVPFVVAFKIVSSTHMGDEVITLIGSILAVVSMLVGNIGALTSQKPARILAYSTVANMGYIIAALIVAVKEEFIYLAFAGAMLQLLTNSIGKIGFFIGIKEKAMPTVETYVLALSFIGLPPLMGFWSKLYILSSLVYANFIWVAVLLVLNSAMSVPYYVRLMKTFEGTKGYRKVAAYLITLTAVLMLLTVVPPNWIIESSKLLMSYLAIGGV
ncbi:proton-conducting transporter membrane subunit [Geoglobus acetivorans]|uniref:NADH-quinone oxidoreductase subunit N n=1 Tax=Geoglobus acetivorans TaxID=565033 RepID=A0ABZ3H2D4_GEOAI|nr:NADH-quinone oxidoreductase subunit N [Geoglobus acetivorans]